MSENMDEDILKIGSLNLKSRYILAPLEGVSDIGFRQLCYKNGAGITWTEMIRASGIARKNKATLDLIDTYDPTTLTGIQIFAVNENELKKALDTIEELSLSTHPHFKNIRAIDLNFGCPSPELIRIGAGPALIKRALKMEKILKTLYEWKSSTRMDIGAVGIKIRLGLNQQEKEYKVYLRIIPAANKYLDYITVHARHAKQKSSDLPDWDAIAEIKQMAEIPVIGNGNVFDKKDAVSMMMRTKCDGILIARGAIDNPWIFSELNAHDEENRREGSEIPKKMLSAEIIKAAKNEYLTIANTHHTKEKYLEFHTSNFERLIARAKNADREEPEAEQTNTKHKINYPKNSNI